MLLSAIFGNKTFDTLLRWMMMMMMMMMIQKQICQQSHSDDSYVTQ